MESQREALEQLQEKLATQVNIPEEKGYLPQDGDVVLALDIQYQKDAAHVAGDFHYWNGDHIGTFAGVIEVDVPYVPSFFCFREGPPLLSLIEHFTKTSLPSPNLIVVDGHGIAHPRQFGVACWLGLATSIPTIGCAKETLVLYEGELEQDRGATVDVKVDEKTVGYVVRRIEGVNPVFVSPGHLVSLSGALSIVLDLPGKYKIPDPIRLADQAARSHCKGISQKTWKNLGELTLAKPFWRNSETVSNGDE